MQGVRSNPATSFADVPVWKRAACGAVLRQELGRHAAAGVIASFDAAGGTGDLGAPAGFHRDRRTAVPGGAGIGAEVRDYDDDTMALLACLDVVVTVDTSVGHLAAAIVRPVWILLATSPDWRWLLEREVRSLAALGGGEGFPFAGSPRNALSGAGFRLAQRISQNGRLASMAAPARVVPISARRRSSISASRRRVCRA